MWRKCSSCNVKKVVPVLSVTGIVQPGDSVLIHAGASDVDTAAIQLTWMAGAIPLVTAGSQHKLQMAEKLGAAGCRPISRSSHVWFSSRCCTVC